MLKESISTKIKEDVTARKKILQSSGSFIIQAPAGSGKTELLIQKFLKLLTQVSSPSEIIAVTFTKKACGEMRKRIWQSLENAKKSKPKEKYQQTTWHLANNVLQHAKKNNWSLNLLTGKLNILTIDALCQNLLNISPYPYNTWGKYQIATQSKIIYKKALQQFIKDSCLSTNGKYSNIFYKILIHNHYDQQYLENLLIEMLADRSKWINIAIGLKYEDYLAEKMHKTINILQSKSISKIKKIWPLEQRKIFITSLLKQHRILQQNNIITSLDEIATCYNEDDKKWDFNLFYKISKLILKKDGLVKKRMTSKEGFLSKENLKKIVGGQSFELEQLQKENLTYIDNLKHINKLVPLLASLDMLPKTKDSSYESYYQLTLLLQMLPALVAYLHYTMQSLQQTDFTQIQLQVMAALADTESSPSLSYQIYQNYKHILIDECQDISLSQFNLFSTILEQWQGEKDRTVTLVGDPMQSIYRFRQADVTLFKRIQKYGIGGIKLEQLILYKNYRSSENLVNWYNYCFENICAAENSDNQFNSAISSKTCTEDKIKYIQTQSGKDQAEEIAKILISLNSDKPSYTKCLLVRSRTHLESIIPILNKHEIPYNAQGINSLKENQDLHECISLILLGQNINDRENWIALLRSSFVGISWQDIYILAHKKEECIWENIQNINTCVSIEARKKLQRIVTPLKEYLNCITRENSAFLAKKLWHKIGGPYAIKSSNLYQKILVFFQTAEEIETVSNDVLTKEILENILSDIDEPEIQSTKNILQIMSVHKSKGLEFDIIICPSIDKQSPISKKPLLEWAHIEYNNQNHLLLHTHPKSKQKSNSIHKYLRYNNQQQENHELVRLCYVAFTRAKQELYILSSNSNREKPSSRSWESLLKTILNKPYPNYEQKVQVPKDDNNKDKQLENNKLINKELAFTLDENWRHPFSYPNFNNIDVDSNKKVLHLLEKENSEEVQWGNMIHHIMELVAREGLHYLENINLIISKSLNIFNIEKDGNEKIIIWLVTKIKNLKKSKTMQWILHDTHIESFFEKSIYSYEEGSKKIYRADCVFIDKENTIWIIDYKTSAILKMENSLPHSKQTYVTEYAPKIKLYQRAIQKIYPSNKIKAALFFPLQDELITID